MLSEHALTHKLLLLHWHFDVIEDNKNITNAFHLINVIQKMYFLACCIG